MQPPKDLAPLVPLPPAGDPRWRGLGDFRRRDVERALTLLALWERAVEAAGSVKHAKPLAAAWARALKLGAVDRDGRRVKKDGTAGKSIYNFYLRWKKEGGDWWAAARFHGLVETTPPSERLNWHELSAAQIDAWFERNKIPKARWAKANGYDVSLLARVLSGERAGPAGQRLLDAIHAEMTAGNAALRRELDALRAEWKAFGPKLDSLDKRLP